MHGFDLRLGVLCGVVMALILPFGCRHQTPVTSGNEQPYDVITVAFLDSLGAAHRTTSPLRADAYHWRWTWFKPRVPLRIFHRAAKIDSALASWIADSSATKIDTLVVTFTNTVRIPRFPDPVPTKSHLDAANVAALSAAEVLVNTIATARDSAYAADSLDLVQHYQATILERYWITQALKVTMPIGKVDSLSQRHDVVFIQRNRTGSPPPGFDSNAGNDPAYARDILHSDPYFNLGLSYGWVSLLDTGVRGTHMLFQSDVSPFNRLGDCVDGDATCTGGSSADLTLGHGTTSAAILVASNPSWPRFRGVTAATLDAFRVYAPRVGSGPPELMVDAALRGFQSATSMLDRVVIAEMQEFTPEAAAIGNAADGVYLSGATVIAANGNYGLVTPDKMANPARARRVIGVGARDVMSQNHTDPTTSYGTTLDGRYKPDVQAPSSTESAGSTADDANYYLGATSGATPYAGGSAALLRNWLVWAAGRTVDPGQINAQLILSGSKNGPFDTQSQEGAGELVLPTNGWCYFGKVEITNSFNDVEIPIPINWANMRRFEAALWWPEELVLSAGVEVDTHNDINLSILDANGNEVGKSMSTSAVYERATAEIPTSSGTWKIKIHGQTLRHVPQTVFWTVALRF